MRNVVIQSIPIGHLRPNPRNARTHSKQQIEVLAATIGRFGFLDPVLATADGMIVAGHARVEAAKRLGMTEVPVIVVDHLSPAEVKALAIAHNRLAELAGWDRSMLALELKELSVLDLDFALDMTGFESAEIDLMIQQTGATDPPPAEEEPPLPVADGPAVTRVGDLWQVGHHRILCGDALDPASYARLMAGEQAAMVFTDPPFNVRIAGHVKPRATRHAEFAMASGEMSAPGFAVFLETALRQMAAVSRHGALHFCCMDWRHLSGLLAAARPVYSSLINICVWAKTHAGMGSLYRSQHELVSVFRVGRGRHRNNVQLGRFGRNRSNVWTYPSPSADDLAGDHPTPKPVALVADAILDCTARGDIVLDGFAGSGTTLVAAARTGRRGHGIEVEPKYVDLTLRRLRQETGTEPVLVGDGRSFDLVAAERLGEAGPSPVGTARASGERRRRVGK